MFSLKLSLCVPVLRAVYKFIGTIIQIRTSEYFDNLLDFMLLFIFVSNSLILTVKWTDQALIILMWLVLSLRKASITALAVGFYIS